MTTAIESSARVAPVTYEYLKEEAIRLIGSHTQGQIDLVMATLAPDFNQKLEARMVEDPKAFLEDGEFIIAMDRPMGFEDEGLTHLQNWLLSADCWEVSLVKYGPPPTPDGPSRGSIIVTRS